MTTPQTGIAVRRSLAVDAPRQRAFETFVDMTAWWPLATHTAGAAPARASVVEPKTGGRWYEVDANGDEQSIGSVLAYEPPARIVLAWQMECERGYDPALVTELEIRFVAETPTRTRVELEHRGLEAYGANAEFNRRRYEGDDAWTYVLDRYARHVGAGA